MNEIKKELQKMSEEESKVIAIISFIMSILSLLQCSSVITSALYGIASIILGACALYVRENDGFAKAGIIISIVSIVLSIIVMIIGAVTLFATINELLQQI